MEEKLDNGLEKITAGKSVADFLNDINDNFSQVQTTIEGAPKKITISLEVPSGGEHGDIWIQYEE